MAIGDFFHNQRVETTLHAALILVYFPLGSVLLLFRLFLTLNFICAQIVFNILCSPHNVVRRFFEKVFMAVLGIYVNNHNTKQTKSLAVANLLNNCDPLFICILCGYKLMNKWGVRSSFLDVLNMERRVDSQEFRRKSLEQSYEQGHAVIVFPECQPTNGKGLIKFDNWAIVDDMQIQPVAVNAWRVIPVTLSTLDSTWWQDLLWTYFSVLTIYNITYLPSICKSTDESHTEFTERIRKSISQQLEIACTNVTSGDIAEHIKRLKFEARKPQQHLASCNSQVELMASQVKGILPHVPMQVIINDLGKTRSVDLTVTNILEGVVKYVPEEPNTPSSSKRPDKPSNVATSSSNFSGNPTYRHMSLQERKEAFIRDARAAYLAKRGLKSQTF